jgi:serine/threonine protein kinase
VTWADYPAYRTSDATSASPGPKGGTGVTRTLTVLGTAAYLSPEQASGRPGGPQADLYSLGCVLFQMRHPLPRAGHPGRCGQAGRPGGRDAEVIWQGADWLLSRLRPPLP